MPETDVFSNKTGIVGRTSAGNMSPDGLRRHAAAVIAGWAATCEDARAMLELYGLADVETLQDARGQLRGGVDA